MKNRIATSETIFEEMTSRASLLRDSGVTRGDKILISHGNSAEFFIDLFAIWEVGASAACLNPNVTDFELKKIFYKCFKKETIVCNSIYPKNII